MISLKLDYSAMTTEDWKAMIDTLCGLVITYPGQLSTAERRIVELEKQIATLREVIDAGNRDTEKVLMGNVAS